MKLWKKCSFQGSQHRANICPLSASYQVRKRMISFSPSRVYIPFSIQSLKLKAEVGTTRVPIKDAWVYKMWYIRAVESALKTE